MTSEEPKKSESTKPYKNKPGNRVSAFFSKLVSWKSSTDNLSSSPKAKRKSKLKKGASFAEENEKVDFGVSETETLKQFQRPKPPRNRRRPGQHMARVKPILEEEPNEAVEEVEEVDHSIDLLDEVVLRRNSNVIKELSRSLSSGGSHHSKQMLRKSNSVQSEVLETSRKSQRASELFTHRMLSQEDEQENPTSL